ncbi:MAG: hypothetical protein GY874_05830 [Desulfobacteraceae bacterium]|nr:hypothetical protein [Desulfobacteraceae bacterium]
MKKRLLITFCAVLVVLTACASTNLRPEVGTKLKSGNVAAMFYMDHKTIDYDELVYKVLWNEKRQQLATFGSFWDIDKDLSNTLANTMGKIGISTKSVNQLLFDEDDYNALRLCIVDNKGPDGKNWPLTLTPGLQKQFKDLDVDYLVVLRTVSFSAEVNSMFKHILMRMPSILIIYDINNGKEEYRELFGMGGGHKYNKSARELEEDGLKQLKKLANQWIATAVEKQFPKTLSLATN